MRSIIMWAFLASLLFLLGMVVAEKSDMARQANRLVGIDAPAVGAVCNPDWEALNPFGCRYRFNLAEPEFAELRCTQLTPGKGWEPCKGSCTMYPGMNKILTDDARIFTNHDHPTRVRWVVYLPTRELLYLGYYMH